MKIADKVRLIQEKCDLSAGCIRSRLDRNWAVDRIISTPAFTKQKVNKNHPYRKASYDRVATRKGWES